MKKVCFGLVLTFCSALLFAADSPGDISEALKKGAEFEKADKLDDALTAFRDALKIKETEELYRKTGAILGKLQRYDEALTLLHDGLEKFPGNTSLINLSGFIQLKKGNKDEALKLWKDVLAKDPNNSFAKEWTAKTGIAQETASSTPASETGAKPESKSEPVMVSGDEIGLNKSGEFKVDESMPLPEQEKMAVQIFQDLSQTDQSQRGIYYTEYRKVIEKCPKSSKAAEACWRYYNTCISEDERDYENIAKVLEHLVQTYPESPYYSNAKNQLIFVYQQAKNNQKLVNLFSEMFQYKDQIPAELIDSYSLEYADALSALGKKADAKAMYEDLVARKGTDDECDAAQVAKLRLKDL